MVLLVFSHQQSPCTWSLPYFYEQDTFQAKCGGISRFPIFLQVKVLNLSNQNQNSKPRWVWWKKTSPLQASSQESSSLEQTEVFGQWTSQGEVLCQGLKTPNPHRKSYLGGEAHPCIQVNISFLCFIIFKFALYIYIYVIKLQNAKQINSYN